MDPLIQDHYRVIHVVVHEVDPKCTPACGPPKASPHPAINAACYLQEGDPVVPEIVWGVGGRGGGVHKFTPVHPVTDFPVEIQGPFLQVRVALRSENLVEEPLMVGVYLPHNPEAVGLCKVSRKHASMLTRHSHHLVQLGADAHTVEQLRQCVKITMEACFLSKHVEPISAYNHAANRCTSCPKPSVPAGQVPLHPHFCHRGDPVSEDHIYDHIEDCGI